MRKFTPADYRVMPWKNGGGTTTELYVESGADGAFLWRVSIADVAVDGPFSTFTGYDRHIMAIEGSGMILDGGPDGPIEVNPKFVPRSFSGDWAITSRLISGPVRDFNLMSRREAIRSHLDCLELTRPMDLVAKAGETTLAYLLEGELTGDKSLRRGESLLLLPGEMLSATPAPSSSPPKLALCSVSHHDPA